MKGLSEIFALRSDLSQYRKRAWDALALPLGRKEPYKYMPMGELEQLELVDHRGSWSYEVTGDLVVMGLVDAWKSYGGFLQARKGGASPFGLMAKALMDEGLFIYAPSGVTGSVELTLDEKQFPHVSLLVGKGAQVKVSVKGKAAGFTAGFVDAEVDEGAQLTWVNEVETDKKTWFFDTFCANVKRDGVLKHYALTKGGKCVRGDVRVQLEGTGACATMKGLAELAGERQAHQFVHVEHMDEGTYSDQHYKMVLEDAAKSSFEGKIYVQPQAQQTMAYQLNNNLLLGDKVVANSKPNLEIFADDVKASHGCTMTRLNEEEAFYLKSRGLDDQTASKLLKQGFIQEIIDAVRNGT